MSAARRSFESINVGDEASLVRTITADDVRRFAELTGDDNPLHVDRAFAESTPFKDIVVHGMLGASLLSALIGTDLPGEGAVWVSQTLEFRHPIRLDDTLTVIGVVTKKHARERLIELEARIVNQRNVVVVSGTGTVKVMAAPEKAGTPADVPPGAIFVSGGTGGIGRAVCRVLAREGYSIVVGYRGDGSRADALVAEIGTEGGGTAIAMNVDVTEASAVDAAISATVRRFKTLTAVVHCASPAIGPSSFDQLDWSAIAEHLDVDARGAFNLAKAAVPHMTPKGSGRVVVITSGELDGPPTPGWTAYAVGKAALATMARSLAVELGPSGITVNCVSPGMTDTALIGDLSEKARLVLARRAPLRRLASPEDVAGAVAFLISPRAGYITGETIRVNGGQFTL